MAIVSISEAAKLAGVSRGTIYNRIEDGDLSRTPDGIDIAELIRVFGALKRPDSEHKPTDGRVEHIDLASDVTEQPKKASDGQLTSTLTATLVEQLSAAEREKEWLREMVEAAQARVREKDLQLLEKERQVAEREAEFREQISQLTDRIAGLLPAPDAPPPRRKLFGIF